MKLQCPNMNSSAVTVLLLRDYSLSMQGELLCQ